MLKTVNFPTWSALGNIWRSSTKEWNEAGFTCLYHCCSAEATYGCLAANSFRRLRVMMCIVTTQPLLISRRNADQRVPLSLCLSLAHATAMNFLRNEHHQYRL